MRVPFGLFLIALWSGACTPAPTPSAAPGTPLEGTDWNLVEVGGRPVPAAEGPERAGIRLVADGRKVQGSGGCNRMAGTYELDGPSLKFGPLATTRMFCPAMEVEDAFLKALGATTRYQISGSSLTLFGADGPVARLETGSATPG